MNSALSAYLRLVTNLGVAGTGPAVPNAAVIPNVGHCFLLRPGQNTIGREAASDVAIVLPSMTVSRRHARVEMSATGSWEIEDLHSRNGTALNGQKLQPHILTPMNEGDRIGVSGVELIFTCQRDPKGDPKGDPNPTEAELEEWLEGPYK